MAVELTARYEDGFLPESGGWYDQDSLFTDLIGEALTVKRRREKVEQEKERRKTAAKTGRRRR